MTVDQHRRQQLLKDLRDLLKQATTERSHHYTADCLRRAIFEIEELERSDAALSRIRAMFKDGG